MRSGKLTNVDSGLVLHDLRIDRRQVVPVDIRCLLRHAIERFFRQNKVHENNRGNYRRRTERVFQQK